MKDDNVIKLGKEEYVQIQNYSTDQIIKNLVVNDIVKVNQKPKADETSKDNFEESKQIEDDYYSEIIEPPYDPLLWASLMEKNTRLAKLIRTYARNTVGLGWHIKAKKPITKTTTENQKNQIEKEKELLEEFFGYCNPLLPFEEILFRAKVDEEAMGNGYVEITRNVKGLPAGVYHIPGHTIRMLKNKQGFIQVRGLDKTYFKIFNGNFDMNCKTGEIKPKNSIPFAERASEIIPFSIYNPRDSYYGIPRYVSTAEAIAGNKLSARRNLSFFKNDATPRMAITVTNGQLTGQSISDIKDFVKTEGKGVENAHRVMILQAKAKQLGDANSKDVKIDVIPLTVGQTDDASFVKYRNANDEEIREAFGIGEIFLGGKGSVNRSTATIMREITNEQEFIPDIKVKEYLINQTICRAFGTKAVKFEFERPTSLGSLDRADIFARYQQGGGVTPNDIRHELGKDEYTEDWGDKPIQIGLVEYQMGLLGAQGAISQGGKIDEGDDEGSNSGESGDNNSNNSKNSVKLRYKNQEEATRLITDTIQNMIKQNLETVKIELEPETE